MEVKNILFNLAITVEKVGMRSSTRHSQHGTPSPFSLDLLISLRFAISLLLSPNRYALSHILIITNSAVENTMEGAVTCSYINWKDLRKGLPWLAINDAYSRTLVERCYLKIDSRTARECNPLIAIVISRSKANYHTRLA